MSGSINDSVIPFKLDGEDRELVATPNAALKLSRLYGGLGNINGKIVHSVDPEVFCNVIRIGMNLNDKESQGLADKVFRTGYSSLIPVCIDYVVLLINGGRRVAAENSEGNGEESTQGNPSA